MASNGPARKFARAVVCGCLVLTCRPALMAQSGSYLITTVAGLGNPGLSGDGGPALFAGLSSPSGLAVDALGNIFIADTGDNVVRKVTPEGIVSTVAGTGVPGYSGDGAAATAAELNEPSGIAIDAAGDLFIADFGNSRVRMVTSRGIITTVAGNGVKIAYLGGGTVTDGPATTAELGTPNGVAVDTSGTLYIADPWACQIWKVTQGSLSAVPGSNCETGFSPFSVATDGSGNLLIVDLAFARVLEMTPQGIITTVAGNEGPNGCNASISGPATSASLCSPIGVAVDTSGNIFVADNAWIRKISLGAITTIAGSNNDVSLGGGDGGPAMLADLAGFGTVKGVAVDATGAVLVSGGLNRIRKLLPTPRSNAGCTYSLDQSSQSFLAAGGTSTVGVLTSGNTCPWSDISYAPWIGVNSPTDIATGLGLVNYTASSNPNSAARNGTFWVAGSSFGVSQSGVSCSLSASPSMSVAATGEVGATLTVTTSAPDCPWTAAASVPWILVSGGTSGTGSGAVTYSVGINTGGQRMGAITVTGQASDTATLTVNQFAVTDLEGTGSTTVADVQLVINEAMGAASARNDLNYDGVVNISDVQIVINRALPTAISEGLTVSPASIMIGSSLCNDYQNLTVTSSSGTVPFTVGIDYGNGDLYGQWLNASAPGSGSTNSAMTFSATAAATGTTLTIIGLNLEITTATPTATVVITPSSASAIGITVYYTESTSCSEPGSGNVTVSPTVMTFAYAQGESVPAAQTATIVNALTATASIPFTVSTTETNGTSIIWLIVSTSSASTPYNNPGLSVSVAPGSLSPGTYTGIVTIMPTGGSAETIAVTLTITG